MQLFDSALGARAPCPSLLELAMYMYILCQVVSAVIVENISHSVIIYIQICCVVSM